MSDDNKIVPFPAHRARKPSQDGTSTDDKATLVSRRNVIVVSIIATVFVATLVNSRLSKQQNLNPDGGRNLAGANDHRSDFNDDLLLAKKIARESLRQPASRGREPTSEEKLRFGSPLNGSYLIQMNEANGALESVKYIQNSAQIRMLPSPVKFLNDQKDLIKIDFDTNNLKPIVSTADQYRIEEYELRARNTGEKLGSAIFQFDKQGYFYSMKVEKN